VRFWRTDEYYYSPMDQGNNDQLDSDVDYLTGTTPCFELSTGEVDTSWDAGVVFPSYHGDVGDFVWNDENRNGIQDPGERGLPNVVVIINNCDGLVIDTTFTDSAGHYVFHDRGIARAYLRFVLPEGFRFSPMDQGSTDSLDSDANPETGNTVCFDIPESNPILIWDAGMFREEQSEEGCTWRLSWWKNHAGFGPQPDSVSQFLPLWLGFPDGANSIHVTSNRIAVAILRIRGEYGHPFNGITKLYAQLLAAKLNIANGASDRDIAETIAQVDLFLSTHDWHDWSGLRRHERQTILDWVNRLADYNNGRIGPGRCHWEDDDEL
jgi:hypothetical protein